jgi:hypothetical protein
MTPASSLSPEEYAVPQPKDPVVDHENASTALDNANATITPSVPPANVEPALTNTLSLTPAAETSNEDM